MDDKFVCPPRVTAALVRKVSQLSARRSGSPAAVISSLTPRQIEIASLLGRGLTNKEIATQLSICPTTVRNHLHAIFERLNVKRRAEAVAHLHIKDSAVSAPIYEEHGDHGVPARSLRISPAWKERAGLAALEQHAHNVHLLSVRKS